MNRKVIGALDTGDLDEALRVSRKLADHIGGFKIGHALTLQYGLDVIPRLQDVGAHRIFLDLKFHDIPNSVALGVREAAKRGVWMLTLHTAGGPAMMTAAVEEAKAYGEADSPLLIGITCLTSLDQHVLTDYLGVQRPLEDHMVFLSKLAVDCGLDGVVTSPREVAPVRNAIGNMPVIVTPGIRLENAPQDDQRRVGTAIQALADGATYLVLGRALIESDDVPATLARYGLIASASH